MSPWGGAASCQSVSMRYSVSFLISCGLAHVSVHTLWRLGANIVAGHVSVHTLWRLGALFALSTRSGASAHCLHCPHALEARRSSGGSAHCSQQFWRLGALSTFASILSQTHFDECSLQFRLFPVPFDETIARVSICEYPTNPWGTMMRPSIVVFVRYRDLIGG